MIDKSNWSTRLALAAVMAASATLTIAGCSGGDSGATASSPESGSESVEQPTATQNIYQFDEARVMDEDDQIPFVSIDADSPITVRLSEDLVAAVADGLVVAVDHFVVTATAFSTGVCRIDADVFYADGGQEALSAPTSEYKSEPLQNVAASLIGIYPGREDEVLIVDAPPTDDELEYEARYITADGATLTLVDDCSDDPQATDSAQELEFPYTTLVDDLPYRTGIATAYVGVAPGGGQSGGVGTTVVLTGEVDADVSPTGSWQSK
ncbi:hypothetical protein [Microbacterium gorillae]|uniref:hypothetical protein n=1 Tax=Microbacterium gorillae TaxID=1231063 RepID=UPI003D95DD82